MTQKDRYKLAGIIFSGLLFFKVYWFCALVYKSINIGFLWAWRSVYGTEFLSEFATSTIFLCELFSIVVLIALAKDAFREKTDKKSKSQFTVMYVMGILIPWLIKGDYMRFSYMYGSGLIMCIRIIQKYLPVICVLLFVYARYVLMEPGKRKVTPEETEKGELAHYRELYNQGIISKKELETMERRIRNQK